MFPQIAYWRLLTIINYFLNGRINLRIVTSKEYEMELENMNEANQKRVDELEFENEQL